jgi:hypothetical protein
MDARDERRWRDALGPEEIADDRSMPEGSGPPVAEEVVVIRCRPVVELRHTRHNGRLAGATQES